ncbi:WD40 repeat-like protein [Schizophyllum commune H4-8]|uniref:WD40 repeat-like protein n=1 Tax=Schizophyllum commune (strain H4-8 / FGSC 9210) TaxID=578458 RepID=UPI002160B579|nr:WD40 repeat-like protein [Schizophyllum commune H4-8]KAI5884964.1 WD40 repeat-like protein [Schizophyllum commune H4-8]
MSGGLKNSPFGKRLRGAIAQDEQTTPTTKKRFHPVVPPANPLPVVELASASTPSLDPSSRPSTSSGSSIAPESPAPDLSPSKRDYGDRFIPSREEDDLMTSYHLKDGGPSTPSKKSRIIPSESDALKEQANTLFTSVLHTEVAPEPPSRPSSPVRSAAPPTAPTTPTRRRIFAYSSPTKHSPQRSPERGRTLDDPTSSAYSLSPVRAQSKKTLESPRRQLRNVCKTPYRVLDAPELAEDFYLNLVDWSSTNVLGVGLGACVYLWTAHNAQVSKLCDLSSVNDQISSVSWVQKGSLLAVGTFSGRLYIYDASTLQLSRQYTQAHSQRIGSLAWNSHLLSSGSRDRMIHHRDVREPGIDPVRRSNGHRQEVCGLKWSNGVDGGHASGVGSGPAGLLASGGNDNKVCIWDLRGSRRPPTTTPSNMVSVGLGSRDSRASASGSASGSGDEANGDSNYLFKFHAHTAAVKALAWDPHVSGILATGGGTQDKHIRWWNCQNAALLGELDTGSQVCNLIWSLTSHELVSTHGYSSSHAQNQICIWKYPSLEMVASLTGHMNRVLYLAMSPDGETIVTGAGDETLRFWNAFPKRSESEREGLGLDRSRLDYGRLLR